VFLFITENNLTAPLFYLGKNYCTIYTCNRWFHHARRKRGL